MPEQFANAAESTLAAAMDTVQTTLQVLDASSFPTSGNFRILVGVDGVDAEIMLVTGVSGTTFTVTRAAEPYDGASVANGHGLGAPVVGVLTAASVQLAGPGSAPAGPAGGDLGGSYPNPSVAALQGSPVSSSPPATGDLLMWNGSAWVPVTPVYGTVVQVNTGTGLTGGPITSTGTIDLADTAVTPGSYGDATHVGQFTVDQQGRITTAANVAISGGGGGIAIGNPVGSGTNNTVLYIDGSGNLACHSTFLFGNAPEVLQNSQSNNGSPAASLGDSTAAFIALIGQLGTVGVTESFAVHGQAGAYIGALGYVDLSGQEQAGFFTSADGVKIRLGNNDGSLLQASGVTDGTSSNTATLNNAPSGGDPTSWLMIKVGGTTKYIPAW